MNTQELLDEITRVYVTRRKEIDAANDKAENNKKALLKVFARDNARFKAGEVIMENHPAYGPVPFTIIRVETVSAFLDGKTPVIAYRGRELNPDFTEALTIYSFPRNETINVRPDSTEPTLLRTPLYTSFVVINAEGKEFPTKSYRETIEIARRELTGTKTEYVIRYGITPSGARKEIQKIYNVKK